MKYLKIVSMSSAMFLLPFLVSAQGQFSGQQQGQNIGNLIGLIGSIINGIIPIIIGLALVVFLWGILMYVISKGADDKEKARGFMIWGIIGLFVMVSVWGIVNVLSDAVFGGTPTNQPTRLPTFTPAVRN